MFCKYFFWIHIFKNYLSKKFRSKQERNLVLNINWQVWGCFNIQNANIEVFEYIVLENSEEDLKDSSENPKYKILNKYNQNVTAKDVVQKKLLTVFTIPKNNKNQNNETPNTAYGLKISLNCDPEFSNNNYLGKQPITIFSQ